MKHRPYFQIQSFLTEPPASAVGNEEPSRSPVFASVNGHALSTIESKRPPLPSLQFRRANDHTN